MAKPATLNNCVVEGSTAAAPKYCNNGLVSTDPAQAALIVDGVAIRFAEKAETMTAIAKDATIDTNIILASDVTGDAILLQKADIDLVVDGDNHNYTGTIYIHGQARHTGAETLAIQNVNFVSNETIDFISSNTTVSTERYAHNVTIKDCTFTGSGNGDVVGARFRQAFNIAIENCTANALHSLMWITGGVGVTVDGAVIKNSKNGVSFGTSDKVVVKNSKITAIGDYGYALRTDASGAYSLKVSNSTLKADAPILMRKATAAASLALEGNTLTSTDTYQIIVTASDYEAGKELTAATGNVTITGGEGLNIFK